MPKKNRICLNCGKPYYVCRSCISINSWKNVCCSIDCFRELVEKQNIEIAPRKVDEGEVQDMFLILKDDKNTQHEVIGYDLTLGRFDTKDGITHTKEDIDYLQLTVEELQSLVK